MDGISNCVSIFLIPVSLYLYNLKISLKKRWSRFSAIQIWSDKPSSGIYLQHISQTSTTKGSES